MADPDKVFDVEVADSLSPGCGSHADPNCLCDVDLTKAIAPKRWPVELAGVETGPELVQRWANYVYRNEIEGPYKPLTTQIERNLDTLFPRFDGGDTTLKQLVWPQLLELSEAEIDKLVAELRSGKPALTLAREWDLPRESVQSFARTLRMARPPGGEPVPWRAYAIRRYAEGIPSPQICAEIAERWQVKPPKVRQISSWANHAGVARPNSTKVKKSA